MVSTLRRWILNQDAQAFGFSDVTEAPVPMPGMRRTKLRGEWKKCLAVFVIGFHAEEPLNFFVGERFHFR
jgi:hypothetical protein